MQVAKDYSQGIEHLASGKVDFSRFGPASYIEAKKANSGLRILAMERVNGDKVFYGIIAVAKDNPIASVNELRGKSFAFGNDQSTIGRYLSQQFLRNNGIFSTDLSRYEYLGRHDAVGTAVGAHHFEAGALNESTFTKLVSKGVAIRELARFPNVTKPWIAREGLPPALFEAVRQALLNLSDPVLHKTLKVDGFVSGDDADYEDIRTAIEKNNLFFEGADSVTVVDAKEPTPTAIGVESARIAATDPSAQDPTPLPLQ
jgi:phosphonate transport system substrate-binding protein